MIPLNSIIYNNFLYKTIIYLIFNINFSQEMPLNKKINSKNVWNVVVLKTELYIDHKWNLGYKLFFSQKNKKTKIFSNHL